MTTPVEEDKKENTKQQLKLQLEKNKLKQNIYAMITRQISGFGHNVEDLERKIKELKVIREGMNEIIDNADHLFGD